MKPSKTERIMPLSLNTKKAAPQRSMVGFEMKRGGRQFPMPPFQPGARQARHRCSRVRFEKNSTNSYSETPMGHRQTNQNDNVIGRPNKKNFFVSVRIPSPSTARLACHTRNRMSRFFCNVVSPHDDDFSSSFLDLQLNLFRIVECIIENISKTSFDQ